MILTQTPLRVSLFGGATDYPEFFINHPPGGAVLGMAINRFVYAGVQPMHPGQDFKYRIQYSRMEDCLTVNEIKHPAIRAALQYYNITEPLEFHGFGDMPGRAGLGSSSAFCVGVLKALQEHFNLPITTPLELAGEAIAFERCLIPETVGCQDQIFAAVGGINFITFNRTGVRIQPIRLSTRRTEELENSLVLVYTGSMRDAHVMAAKQVADVEVNRDQLNNLTELAYAGRNILMCKNYSLSLLGGLLDKAWTIKMQLNREISNSEINQLYQRGLAYGATGGKLLGAGGGGFLLFFVPQENRQKFETKIEAPTVCFKISHTGTKKILL
mgnify:CR=1 FL=1